MTKLQEELVLDALLQIDDPYYLNTFRDAEDEDEWFLLNESYIQKDLQRFMPDGVNLTDDANWRFVRKQLKQF